MDFALAIPAYATLLTPEPDRQPLESCTSIRTRTAATPSSPTTIWAPNGVTRWALIKAQM